MILHQYIPEIFKSVNFHADDINKLLSCWEHNDSTSIKFGMFFKMKNGVYCYVQGEYDLDIDKAFCPLIQFYQKQPSLHSLEKNNNVFLCSKKWFSDSDNLKSIRNAIYKLKTNSIPSVRSFNSTPVDSPVTTRTPSPVQDEISIHDIPAKDFYAQTNIPAFIDETSKEDKSNKRPVFFTCP